MQDNHPFSMKAYRLLNTMSHAVFLLLMLAGCSGPQVAKQSDIAASCQLAEGNEQPVIWVGEEEKKPAGSIYVMEDVGAFVDCEGNRYLQTEKKESLKPLLQVRKGDPRDWFDSEANAIVTRNNAVLAYASRRQDWEQVELPWDQMYALLINQSSQSESLPDRSQLGKLQNDLKQAVSGEVRVPEQGIMGCEMATMAVKSSSRQTLSYPKSDPMAKEVAERLVALAGGNYGEGGASKSIHKVLHGAQTANWVAQVEGARRDADAMLKSVTTAVLQNCRDSGEENGVIIPLLETRPTLLVKRGALSLFRDSDGRVAIQTKGDE